MSGPVEPAQPQGFVPHLIDLTKRTLPAMHPAGRPFVLGGALKIVYDVLLYLTFKDVKPREV